MPLKDLVLREVYAVGLPGVNALHEFLIPVLGAATSYRRVTGYFSSAVLADAAKGIAGLVANGGPFSWSRATTSLEATQRPSAIWKTIRTSLQG